jgi:hypothetical protein
MDELLYKEEMMWLQRLCIAWPKEGDCNTEFFHRKAAARAKNNKIKRLMGDDGHTSHDKKVMEKLATNFFRALYTFDRSVQPEEVVQLFEPLILDAMNSDLCKEFSTEEISGALFWIGPLKAAGWFPCPVLLKELGYLERRCCMGSEGFFDTCQMPTGVNETVIVLLPNKDETELLKDFRPISLCNVIYKVVSKFLVNMLQPLLHELIAPMQSVFVPGRMITNNALIVFECLHAIEQGNSRCRDFGALKLDLAKTYDCVDWAYLEGVLKLSGFH